MKYVRELDGLRGLMALWVLFGHWATALSFGFYKLPHNLGNTYAVDVFIVLSGFAIATLLDRNRESYPRYLARRILRIFPVYWFYLAISIALAWVSLDVWNSATFGAMQDTRAEIALAAIDHFWPNVLTHIVAIQALIPAHIIPKGEFAFLGQAWSISLEWQFYLVAPFAIATLLAACRDWRIAVALVFFLAVLSVMTRYTPTGFIGDFSDKFAIGIATYYLLRWFSVANRGFNPAIINAVCFLIVGLLALARVPSALPLSIWVVATGSVLSPAWGPLGLVSRLLTLRPIETLGKMSYSVYLAHMIPLTLGMLLLNKWGATGAVHAFVLLVITLVGTAILAQFSYNLIELPFQKLGKRLKGGAKPPVAPPDLNLVA